MSTLYTSLTSLICTCVTPTTDNANLTKLRHELNVNVQYSTELQNKDSLCHLYIIHHGDTLYTEQKRLQGQGQDISLNENGKNQMEIISEKLKNVAIAAIYTSDLARAKESADIIAKNHSQAPIFAKKELRGESHGEFEGLQKEEYINHTHYKAYKSLNAEQRIFFPLGEGGTSKADVAKIMIPALREICKENPGKNVVVVTHGAPLKIINLMLGNYSADKIDVVPHGDFLRIEGDGENLFVVPENK